MAVSDYSSTPGSNTTIRSISLAEGATATADINDAIRTLMADLADLYATLNVGVDYQPLDATLTALAGVTTAADKLIYATGADTFATATLSTFARTILDDADAVAVRTTIGAGTAPVISGTGGTSCAIAFGGGLIMTVKDISMPATSTASYAYGNGTTYTSWARAWMSGDDGVSNVTSALLSSGLSSAVIYNNSSNFSTPGVLFSIGV